MKFKLDLPSALNPKGLTGKVQAINPIWRAEDFEPFFLGGIVLHHIAESTLNILAGLFHLMPVPQCLFKGLRMDNIETVNF